MRGPLHIYMIAFWSKARDPRRSPSRASSSVRKGIHRGTDTMVAFTENRDTRERTSVEKRNRRERSLASLLLPSRAICLSFLSFFSLPLPFFSFRVPARPILWQYNGRWRTTTTTTTRRLRRLSRSCYYVARWPENSFWRVGVLIPGTTRRKLKSYFIRFARNGTFFQWLIVRKLRNSVTRLLSLTF